MKTLRTLVIGLALGSTATLVYSQNTQSEKMTHPRIAVAIRELKDAMAYMEAAPHDFGGHKAAAMASCRNAIRDLNLALQYRARDDRGR